MRRYFFHYAAHKFFFEFETPVLIQRTFWKYLALRILYSKNDLFEPQEFVYTNYTVYFSRCFFQLRKHVLIYDTQLWQGSWNHERSLFTFKQFTRNRPCTCGFLGSMFWTFPPSILKKQFLRRFCPENFKSFYWHTLFAPKYSNWYNCTAFTT